MKPIISKIEKEVQKYKDSHYNREPVIYVNISTYNEIFDKTKCHNIEKESKCLGYKVKIDKSISESVGFYVKNKWKQKEKYD